MATQNPQQVQDLLRDIEAIYRRIGETNPFRNFDASAFTDVNDAITVLEQGLISSRRRLSDLINDAGELVSSFRAITSEVTSSNIALSSSTKSFNKLSSIASKMQSDQAGINVLRKKELQSLQKQFEQEQLNLGTNKQSLEQKEQELEQKKISQGLTAAEERELLKVQAAHQATVSLIQDQDSAMAELNRKLEARLKHEEKIEKAMGLGGAAVGALGGALEKLGLGGLSNKLGLDAVNEKMREMSETMIANGENTDTFASKMKVLKGGIKEAGKNLIDNLKDPLAVATLLAKEFVTALLDGDKATGDLAKGFNMSYEAASDLRSELNTVANLSADINVNTKGLQESMMAVGKTLGTNVALNEKDLLTFTKLREQSGMTNENLAAMQRFTLATGGTLEDNTGEFLAQAQITAQNNGVVLNTKQLLEETATVSDAIKLSAGGTAGGFAKAAAQVKALGMSLDKVDAIAGSLLEFESSITSELEAELLVGKDLTLEKARQAALNGDLATVAEEISNQIGSSAQFSEMNRLQQEALAKSVGMTREDLAKTLVEREALVGLSGEEAKAGKETFDNLVEQYGVEKAQQKVKEEGFETLMKQQSVQERLNKSVEKLREVFVSIAQPVLDILDPLVEIVTEILPLVNLILSPVMVAFKAIGKIIQTLIREPLEAVKSIFSGIVDIFKGDFEQGFTKIGKGIIKALVSPVTAIIAGFNSLINGAIDIINKIPGVNLGAVDLTSGWKSMVSIDDGIISPDGGLVVSGEKGTYSLNPNDTVVAGTDLGGGGGGRSTGIDIGPLVAEMQNVRAVLQQILAKEGVVYIDSTKAGTAFAVGTSKLQ
jgi:hypothetical protein